MEEERTKYGLEIPALGSLILTHSLDKQVPALKDFPKEDRPTRPSSSGRSASWSGWAADDYPRLLSLWLRYRHRLYHSRPFQWFALCMGPAGLLALLAGWVTTEVGRQPWVVYGYLRTIDAVSLHSTLQMSISLLAFFVVYSSVFGVGYVYLIRLIKKGPQPVDTLTSNTSGTPARPLSAAESVPEEERI
jgi:cytochrome d ubiquinol oxidase subunit I